MAASRPSRIDCGQNMAGAFERADSGVVCTQKAFQDNDLATRLDGPTCHPLSDFVVREVEECVLRDWDFEDDAVRQEFCRRGIGGLACLYFPSALDERIILVARLLSILYLVGESLTPLDIDDAEQYVEALEAAVKGHWEPDESIPAVWMLCGLLDEMRAQDYTAVDDIMETTLAHLRGSIVRRGRSSRRGDARLTSKSFRIGASLLSSLSPFAMGLSSESDF